MALSASAKNLTPFELNLRELEKYLRLCDGNLHSIKTQEENLKFAEENSGNTVGVATSDPAEIKKAIETATSLYGTNRGNAQLKLNIALDSFPKEHNLSEATKAKYQKALAAARTHNLNFP